MLDRKLLRDIDWTLLGLLLLNSLIGVIFVYSASHHQPGNYCLRQIVFVLVGFVALAVLMAVDYKTLLTYSLTFYIILSAVLFGMLLFSRLVAGTKSWIKMPYFQVQPSELMKIVLILLLAQYFSEYKKSELTLSAVLTGSALVGLPFILTALQPDMGTAILFFPVLFAALTLGGLKKKAMIWITAAALVVGLAGWNFYLKDYQKKRLTTVVFPAKDLQGAGYHVNQSKIAIGSGGLFGNGFMKGSQSQLNFLPARHTDFVFSVIGEEIGFAGILAVLGVYFLFLSRLFRSVGQSRDRAGIYLVFMVAVLMTVQAFINLTMVIGLFPVVGIPLPLLSYGGSSLLTNFLAVGLVLNVKARRYVNV